MSDTMPEARSDLTLLLASPRGFCAGVVRAIEIVEQALELYGPPVYVRHEIVHNRHVVESLRAKGAVFVDELSEIPAEDLAKDPPVIFSAHGVPKSVPADAEARRLFYVDATCPLVSKVHREAERHYAKDHKLVLIGHAGHPEVIGTMGQLPDGAITLVETVEDVARLQIPADETGNGLAYITQTTLSVDDTAEIIAALQARFPDIAAPKQEDICYATTNRQAAMKAIAASADAVLVVGAPNSSNSVRLVEVARQAGVPYAALVQEASDLDWERLAALKPQTRELRVGLSAGASAPEELVAAIVVALGTHYRVTVEEVSVAREKVAFKLPRVLTEARRAS